MVSNCAYICTNLNYFFQFTQKQLVLYEQLKTSKLKNKDYKDKEIQDLKEKMQLAYSVAKIGFWEYYPESEEIVLLENAGKLTGFTTNKRIALKDFLYTTFEHHHADILINSFKELVSKNKAFELDLAFTRPDDYRKAYVRIIAQKPKKRTKKILGTVQDISEQKISEEQLKKAKNKAEEADLLKSAFLANMSHEIRTPLNAILGFSRLLTEPNINDKQRQEYSEYITNSASNLLNLIQDIIDVSKIEAGKIHIEKSVCFVNKTLNELKITFEKERENKKKNHIELVLNKFILDDNFAIRTDPHRFTQIFNNLLGNALKFIENGFIEFGYIIPKKNYIQFYVKDTGIGIPLDKRDLIFSRFGQIVNKKIKNPGGTGLGLSITKQLVEKLGGKIWYESELNKGTTFYFTLPFDRIDNTEIQNYKPAKEHTLQIERTLNILTVEDDILNRILLKDLIATYTDKISLDEANNGRQALQKLKEKNYDLIIMDIRMPEMDGYETTMYIREKFPEPLNKIPILGLSANAIKDEIEKSMEVGMNDILSKPINPIQLIEKIQTLTNIVVPVTDAPLQKETNLNIQSDIVNIDFFKQLFKNNNTKIKKTLNAYVKEIPLQLETLLFCLNKNDFNNLRITAHSMKSTFRYLGRDDLSDTAKSIELMANEKAQNLDLIQQKIDDLKFNWKLVNEELLKLIAD